MAAEANGGSSSSSSYSNHHNDGSNSNDIGPVHDVFSRLQQNYVTLGSTPNKNFTFDTIAGPQHTQTDVFDNIARPLCDTCLLGYNSTLFAYGQSGSGKTFTIAGQSSSSSASSSSSGGLSNDMHTQQQSPMFSSNNPPASSSSSSSTSSTSRMSGNHVSTTRARSRSRPRKPESISSAHNNHPNSSNSNNPTQQPSSASTSTSMQNEDIPTHMTDGLLPQSIDYIFSQLDSMVTRSGMFFPSFFLHLSFIAVLAQFSPSHLTISILLQLF